MTICWPDSAINRENGNFQMGLLLVVDGQLTAEVEEICRWMKGIIYWYFWYFSLRSSCLINHKHIFKNLFQPILHWWWWWFCWCSVRFSVESLIVQKGGFLLHQQVMLVLLLFGDHIGGKGQFWCWLFRIGHNLLKKKYWPYPRNSYKFDQTYDSGWVILSWIFNHIL